MRPISLLLATFVLARPAFGQTESCDCPPGAPAARSPDRDGVKRLGSNVAPEWVARHGGRVWRDAGDPGQRIHDMRFGEATFDGEAFAEVASHLPRLDGLRRLELTGTSVGDASLGLLPTVAPDLEQLILTDTRITDAGLAHVAKLRRLRTLSLAGTNVSAAGLAELSSLERLETLSLDRADIVDADLVPIGGLSSLERLGLSKTEITAAGLAHLEPLSLEHLSIPAGIRGDEALGHFLRAQRGRTRLNLRRWPITDAGMAHVAKHRGLKSLTLTETKVGNEGLKHLRSLKELEFLHASRLDIDATGLAHLRGLPRLRTLFVFDTNVDDGAVAILAGLPLQLLNVNGTKISPRGLEQLQRAHPDARVLGSVRVAP